MTEILHARQFLSPAESAIVVFTRGNHFVIKPDRTGSTGNWRISSNRSSDKVIIYCRSAENEVYTADFAGIIDSAQPGRKIILLRKISAVGVTASNWFEFGGRSQSPVQLVTYNGYQEEQYATA